MYLLLNNFHFPFLSVSFSLFESDLPESLKSIKYCLISDVIFLSHDCR